MKMLLSFIFMLSACANVFAADAKDADVKRVVCPPEKVRQVTVRDDGSLLYRNENKVRRLAANGNSKSTEYYLHMLQQALTSSEKSDAWWVTAAYPVGYNCDNPDQSVAALAVTFSSDRL